MNVRAEDGGGSWSEQMVSCLEVELPSNAKAISAQALGKGSMALLMILTVREDILRSKHHACRTGTWRLSGCSLD